MVTVDTMLGKIFKLIEQDVPAMTGKTAIILTADHGNQDNPPTGADRYAVPFFVWGPGVPAGADLYALNAGNRQLASSYPMTTYSGMQPIRNAEANNLALGLLGLGAIPGSTFDFSQDLAVTGGTPTGPTVTLGLTGSPMAEAAGTATVTATLSAAHTLPVTVNLAFAGTAVLTADYTRSAASIVIAAGSTSGSITLTAVPDTVYENPNETIVVDIATVVNATEGGTQQVMAIITDDDPAPPGGIAVGVSGSVVLSFGTQPAASQWSTASIAGGGATAVDLTGINAAVNRLAASDIASQCASVAGNPGTSSLGVWNSTDMRLATRPTGNTATCIMATLLNTSGTDINELSVSFTLTGGGDAELAGYVLYSSLTGAAGSWQRIGTYGTPGAVVANNIALASPWTNGAMMYVLWVDDNANGVTDTWYGLDDVSFAMAVPVANILSFGLPGNAADIVGTNITLRVPVGTDVTALAPTFAMSAGASCTHGVTGKPIVSGVTPVNFTSPVHYMVKSSDTLTTKDYAVTVVLVNPSGIIHVNIDTATRTGLAGPGGGLGQTWNTYTRMGGSALLDSAAVPTSVGFTTTASNQDPWGSPVLPLLTSGAFNWAAADPYNLVLSGLTAGKKYHLYLASYYPNEQGSKGTFTTTNTTSTVGAQQIDNHVLNGAGGNSASWVRGDNYVLFENVEPDATRKITITLVGSTGDSERRAMLNGFQLVEAVPAGSDYDTWAGSIAGFTDTAADHDPDGDGMTNQQEYAFGLDPTRSSSCSPITVPLDKTTGRFKYTRRANPVSTGLAYTVWTSPDLGTWTKDGGATSGQTVESTSRDGVETVAVTLTGWPLTDSKLFVRVHAE